jgi:hypothetical protein
MLNSAFIALITEALAFNFRTFLINDSRSGHKRLGFDKAHYLALGLGRLLLA